MTKGHLDIVERAATLFDELVIAVYARPSKTLLFRIGERVQLVRQATAHVPNVRVITYTCLTVVCAQQLGAKVLVRGLRAGQDFEGEREMALMNKKLAPDVESIFLMTNVRYQYLSSSLLKEVAELGGDVADLLPEVVVTALQEKYQQRRD